MNTLLSDIKAFRERTGMKEGRFGLLAVGDRKLVRQIREGRDLRLSTLQRIQNFMEEYRAEAA